MDNKLINEWINNLYHSLTRMPLRVLAIFNEFYGEDRVDLQGFPSIEDFSSYINNTYARDCIPQNPTIFNDEYSYEDNKDKTVAEIISDNLGSAVKMDYIKNYLKNRFFNSIFILVHFPHVRITNENDKYVDVNNLWAKVLLDTDGKLNGRFSLNRSEYTMLHLTNDYMHSHISSIPTHDFTSFQNPCTGSGPINRTITSLNRDFDDDLWNLFCLELNKFVSVESLIGGPYHRLEGLHDYSTSKENYAFIVYNRISYFSNVFPRKTLRDFVSYFINKKKLKFNYNNGSYSIGMSYIEFIVLISNEFIDWYNKEFNKKTVTARLPELLSHGILKKCIIDNGSIYCNTNEITGRRTIGEYIGKKVCTFKGRDITINITDFAELNNTNRTLLLNNPIALYILNIIFKVLNFRYGRNKSESGYNAASTKVRYI